MGLANQNLRSIAGLPVETKKERQDNFSHYTGLDTVVKKAIAENIDIDFTKTEKLSIQVRGLIAKNSIERTLLPSLESGYSPDFLGLYRLIEADILSKEDRTKENICTRIAAILENWDTDHLNDFLKGVQGFMSIGLMQKSDFPKNKLFDKIRTEEFQEDGYFDRIQHFIGLLLENGFLDANDILFIRDFITECDRKGEYIIAIEFINICEGKGILNQEKATSWKEILNRKIRVPRAGSNVTPETTSKKAVLEKIQTERTRKPTFKEAAATIAYICKAVAEKVVDQKEIAATLLHQLQAIAHSEYSNHLITSLKLCEENGMTLDKSIGRCIYETIITNAEYIDTSLELMEFYQTHPEIQCEEKIEESFWGDAIKEKMRKSYASIALDDFQKCIELKLLPKDYFPYRDWVSYSMKDMSSTGSSSSSHIPLSTISKLEGIGISYKAASDHVLGQWRSTIENKLSGAKKETHFSSTASDLLQIGILLQIWSPEETQKRIVKFMSELKDDICATHRDRIITLWNLAHQKKILLKCSDYSKDLVSYDRKHQDELNVALQISEKFYFDTDYFTQLTTTYPHLLEQKDEKYYKHKMHIETNYTKIRDAFIHHDKIALWELVERLQYSPVEHSKINELIYQFGAKAIYEYLGNGQRDPHDAVQEIDSLIKVYKEEFGEKRKEQFTIIVLRETGKSEAGYQLLNGFLKLYKPDWLKALQAELEDENGLRNPKFLKLAEHVMELYRSEKLYKSRENLFKIGDISYLLSQKDALRQLDELLISGKQDDKILYEYYTTGVLSARKKDVQAMLAMYKEPKEFLGLDDTHAPKELHNDKKPQHMVEAFPHMDLEAKELISALPLGVYDKLTYFKPFSKTFYIDKSGEFVNDSYFSSLDNSKLKKLVQDYNNTQGKTKHKDTLSFNTLKLHFSTLPQHQQAWIANQLDGKRKRYTAQISPKSDVSNWYNGFNCDSLSLNHGKKVVMMFNPYCADFCLYQDEQSDKVDNLLATSWVTLNAPISQNIAEISKKLKEGSDPRTLFSNEVLGAHHEYILTLDNIEADANFAEKAANEPGKKKVLQDIYTRFFQEYIQNNPLSPNNIPINTLKMNCGMTYGKIPLFEKQEENKTLPIFLNSYSDNMQSSTLQIPINAGEQPTAELKKGVQPMSIEDILTVIYLEGSIYPEGIKEHAGNIQHEITASIINNALKKRENLSFVSYDDNGTPTGYLIAYEGVINKEKDPTPCIYLKDLAVNEKGKGDGLKLIMHCMQKITSAYGKLPIVAELRESTSYPIMQKLLPRYGYKITKDELTRFNNREAKHDVIIEKI